VAAARKDGGLSLFRTDYGGGILTTLARHDRMPGHGMGWRLLSRQTSTAVRKLFPQLRARPERGIGGLLAVKRLSISSGGIDICLVRPSSVGGIFTDWNALRAAEKNASALSPEHVPCVFHSCRSRPASG